MADVHSLPPKHPLQSAGGLRVRECSGSLRRIQVGLSPCSAGEEACMGLAEAAQELAPIASSVGEPSRALVVLTNAPREPSQRPRSAPSTPPVGVPVVPRQALGVTLRPRRSHANPLCPPSLPLNHRQVWGGELKGGAKGPARREELRSARCVTAGGRGAVFACREDGRAGTMGTCPPRYRAPCCSPQPC